MKMSFERRGNVISINRCKKTNKQTNKKKGQWLGLEKKYHQEDDEVQNTLKVGAKCMN